MKHGLALLGAAALLLAGTITAAQARREAPVVSDATILATKLPRTLEEYGFFVDAAAQIPTLGVHPYRLNTPLYSDGAEKLRFIYVPTGERITADGEGVLQFPVGSALIKTFAFGDGGNRKLIETRVLLHRVDGWVALPYRWNEEQTEARLAVAGARIAVTGTDGEEISYKIPNKNQCKECHSLNDVVMPIGPKTGNLSADWLTGMGIAYQYAGTMPVWEERDGAPVADAARAYLDVNCAHCHRPGGMASNSGLDLRWEQEDQTKLGLRKRPVAAGRGSGGLEFDIDPGNPDGSIIVHRMRTTEPGVAMPELGKSTVDAEGVAVVKRWIAQMEGS